MRRLGACAILRPAMKLALYHYDGCPYCQMVRQAARQLGLGDDLELRNILQSSAVLKELVDATGRRTVPCLRIESDDGDVRWMHESYDIVDYLKTLAESEGPGLRGPQKVTGSSR